MWLAVIASVGASPVAAWAASTERVSVSSSGVQANGPSFTAAVTTDGRFVLFNSSASNLVPGDTNGTPDVFLHDLVSGTTLRVSVGPSARQANGASYGIAISPDARFVLFTSAATNLTRTPDRNHRVDVFLRDRLIGATYRVSIPPWGGEFTGDPGGGLFAAGVSDNGRWVAFGRRVAYASTKCCRAVSTFVRDRLHHTTQRIPIGTNQRPVALSSGGRYLTFARDDPHFQGVGSVGIRNLFAGRNTAVRTTGILIGAVAASRDAHDVAFHEIQSLDEGLVLVLWNRVTGTFQDLVSAGDSALGDYTPTGFTSDGRYLALVCNSGLVPGDTNAADDLFRVGLGTAPTFTRDDLTSGGAQIPLGVRWGTLSADGSTAVFDSADATIVPGDTNGVQDVFATIPAP
jgi:hypothetical protein